MKPKKKIIIHAESITEEVKELRRENEKLCLAILDMNTKHNRELDRIKACRDKWEQIARRAQSAANNEWTCIINTGE